MTMVESVEVEDDNDNVHVRKEEEENGGNGATPPSQEEKNSSTDVENAERNQPAVLKELESTTDAPDYNSNATPSINKDDGDDDVENLGTSSTRPTYASTQSASSFARRKRVTRKPRRCSEFIERIDDIPEDLGYENTTTESFTARTNRADAQAAATSSPRRRRTSELMELGTEMKRRSSSVIVDKYETSYRPSEFLFYRPPKQRQQWGQTQVLPRVNWGDLFFDLFYVAAAYNTSNILVESPSGLGCLYFLATFLPVNHLWFMKTAYDSRFVVMDDLYHRFSEVFSLAVLASAMVHIRPLAILSQPSQHLACFAFCLSLALVQAFMLIRYMELYFVGRGDRALIQVVALRDGGMILFFLVLQVAAAVIAGIEYFHNGNGNESHRLLATTATAAAATGDYDDTSSSTTNHIPIVLCLLVSVLNYAFYAIRVVFFFPSDGSHKKFVVPMNVDFTLHRDGEWTMLMLGESILSLLIVDVPVEDTYYFTTFYCCLITVIYLQFLHFRSQPHHANDHALRRDKNRGMYWICLWFAYSASLVALGAAFTLFLRSFSTSTTLEVEVEENDANGEDPHRWLAGDASSSPYSPKELEQRAAHLFSIALALIFLTLDAMSFMHVGTEDSKKRCFCKKEKKANSKGILLVVIRLGIVAFVATLSQWMTNPITLAGIGLGLTGLQCTLRKLGDWFLTESMEDDSSSSSSVSSNQEEVSHDAAAAAPETHGVVVNE